jgi:hypothetical protein
MLSKALQRNAKHEARLSNIYDFYLSAAGRNNQRFFAPLRMTIRLAGFNASALHDLL